MSIGIRGIRIEQIVLSRDPSSGGLELTGQYSLLSTADKVLAKQSLNGYEGLPYVMSPDTEKALNTLDSLVKSDINKLLGLEE